MYMKLCHFICCILVVPMLAMFLELCMILLGASTLAEIRNGKIMNGLPATVGLIPYQVSIQSKKGQHFCGGSIIDAYSVLTAAHCMYSNKQKVLFQPNSIQVWAGGTDRRYVRTSGVMKLVANIFIHGDFNLTYAIHDIAILRIKEPFTFSASIKPIELSTSFITSGRCNISGWGYITAQDNTMSASLRYTELPVASLADCQFDYHMAEITNYMICAGDRNLMRDSCKGDSGGPLVCAGKLEGIVSFGAGCEEPGSLGVYTRVYSYTHWIQWQQTRSDSSRLTSSSTTHLLWLCTNIVMYAIHCARKMHGLNYT